MRIVFTAFVVLFTGCAGVDPVTIEELNSHVDVISSDLAAGRMTGSRGIGLAEEYIISELRAVPGRGSIEVQEFPVYYPFTTGLENGLDIALGSIIRDEHSTDILFDLEHYPLPGSGFTGLEKVSGDIVFAGYGITAPEYEWDDYAGLDVKDKIVLLFRHEPREQSEGDFFEGKTHSVYATFARKIETAYEAGAAGILLMDDPLHHSGVQQRSPPSGFSLEADREYSPGALPALHVSISLMETIFPQYNFRRQQLLLDKGIPPADLDTLPESRALLNLTSSENPIPGRNIFRYIPSRHNTDGLNAEERVLIIGAHHDHIGRHRNPQEGDPVFNGADDNASGTAVVLELAEMFPEGLRNTGLIFVTFSAEELGLLGARSFIESYPGIISRTEGMINFDMVGRNPQTSVSVYYNRESPLAAAFREAAGDGFTLEKENPRQRAVSDSFSFSRAGIPTLFFFTGLHPQYHTPDDDEEFLDYAIMKTVAETGYELIRALDEFLPEE